MTISQSVTRNDWFGSPLDPLLHAPDAMGLVAMRSFGYNRITVSADESR